MKFLLFTFFLINLGIVGVLGRTCGLEGSWSRYQTSSRYTGGLWEEYELIGWGMDGDNKWQDFWSYRLTPSSSRTHYDRVTCNFRADARALPNYIQFCGDCSLTDATPCRCYPYYDIANNYNPYPGPNSAEPVTPPEGWPVDYESGNPPFEEFLMGVGGGEWTLENCKQYKPAYVYYYTYKLILKKDGTFEQSIGISRAFSPSQDSWNNFCELVLRGSEEFNCYVPDYDGSSQSKALYGAEYQYQSGIWEEDDFKQVNFYHNHFQNGCHMKAESRSYPTAVYCGDDSGWRFGAGTTAHARFGCDVGTFFDTETDGDRDIDDSDCESVYVAFDALNPLELTVDFYQNLASYTKFKPTASLIRGKSGSDCFYESTFEDHRNNLPDYRTHCGGSSVVLNFFGVVCGVLLVVVRNIL